MASKLGRVEFTEDGDVAIHALPVEHADRIVLELPDAIALMDDLIGLLADGLHSVHHEIRAAREQDSDRRAV